MPVTEQLASKDAGQIALDGDVVHHVERRHLVAARHESERSRVRLVGQRKEFAIARERDDPHRRASLISVYVG